MRNRLVVLAFITSFVQGCGGGGGSAPAVPPVPNRSPVALDQSEGTDPDVVLNGTLLASDADGDTLSFSIVDNPGSGAVVLGGPGNRDFTYTPDAAFAGTDTFTFRASDGEVDSNTATVTVNVNFKPVATAPGLLTTSDAATVSGTVAATDSEGDAFTFLLETQPVRGVVSAFDTATGDFTYSPSALQDGADSFRVRALDAFQASDPAIVNVEIFRWESVQQFGGGADDSVTTSGFFSDAEGNAFFGGGTESQLGPSAPLGDSDAWIRKVDRRGNELWTVQTGTVNQDGARVVAPAPDGSGVYALINHDLATGGAELVKYDADGNQVLNAVIDFGVAPSQLAVYWGDLDPGSDMWVLTWTPDDNSYVTKVDGVTGNTSWQIELVNSDLNAALAFFPETQDIRVRSVDFDSAGNAIVSGWLVDSGTFSRGCFFCSWMASFDTDGNLLWKEELTDFPFACGEPEESRVYRARVAADDTIWVSGSTTFPPAPGLYAQVSKYSADGTQIQWSHCTTPADEATTLFTPVRFASNGDGLVLTSTGGVLNQTTSTLDTFGLNLTRLDADGNVIFSRDFAGTRADSSQAQMNAADVYEDAQGLIYVSGSTDGELTSSAAAGGRDVFLLRFDAAGNPR